MQPKKVVARSLFVAFVIFAMLQLAATRIAHALEPLKYNHPGLTVDLGVGLWAWPMPMDWDGDGDLDLVVSCPDTPYNGAYFFENSGDDPKLPVFKKAVRVSGGIQNCQLSVVDGKPRVLAGRNRDKGLTVEYVDFLGKGFEQAVELSYKPVEIGEGRVRANQWKYVDFDGDGAVDLIYGAGYWGDYGWDNAFDELGQWQRGPLRGHVFVYRNKGTTAKPDYEEAFQLQACGKVVDVFGMPSANFADFDGDGDLDLICGEFLDGFTYFQNIGTRENPIYDAGVYLTNAGRKVAMHVQMITPIAIDWDSDGDSDLICGDEDGRVALVEHTGTFSNGMPVFNQPVYFQQEADDVKFGALITPYSFDWDGDGDQDLVCGNTSGNIGFIENLDGGNPPQWAAPVLLDADGKTIHIQAGENGSIQGPAEAKWGYTVLNVADWDHDGLPDVIVNSIWGKIEWFRNVGTRSEPKLSGAKPVKVNWPSTPPKPAWNWWNPRDGELSTAWRTTPCVVDWNQDGLNDLVMLDHEGYLAFYERIRSYGEMVLLPGKRIFLGDHYTNKHEATESLGNHKNSLLRLNVGQAGASGRRKLCFADWDGDGDLDLLINSTNISWMENAGTQEGETTFVDRGAIGERRLAGHTTSPAVVDWDQDGRLDLVVGAEDGRLYYLANPGQIP